MDKTVIGSCDTVTAAENIIYALAGSYSMNNVSVIARDISSESPDVSYNAFENTLQTHDTESVLQNLFSMFNSQSLRLPGLGPITAMGDMAAYLDEHDAQAVLNALSDLGVPASSGRRYEEEIRVGKVIITMRGNEDEAGRAARVMEDCGAHAVHIY